MLNYVAFNKDAACQLVDIVTDRFTGAIDDYDYACAKVFSECTANHPASCTITGIHRRLSG